jgi:hypothetical protein
MGEAVLVPLRQMVEKVLGYRPQLLGGLVILALGWFVAWAAKKLVIRFMIVLRLHRLLERSEWGAALQKGDVRYTFIEGPRVVLAAFLITGGSMGAALVLAFGLGAARRFSNSGIAWAGGGAGPGGSKPEALDRVGSPGRADILSSA